MVWGSLAGHGYGGFMNSAVCRECGLPIVFAGRGRILRNPDGTEHFDACRREQNRLWQTFGMPERTVKEINGHQIISEGFVYRGEYRAFHIIGPTIVGPNYKPPQQGFAGLPWECQPK